MGDGQKWLVRGHGGEIHSSNLRQKTAIEKDQRGIAIRV